MSCNTIIVTAALTAMVSKTRIALNRIIALFSTYSLDPLEGRSSTGRLVYLRTLQSTMF